MYKNLLFVLLFGLSPTWATAQSFFQYLPDGETVVLKMEESLGELEITMQSPSVTVFGDGRVDVFYPHFMKRAGRYTMTLDAAQMEQLLKTVSDSKIPTMDSNNVKNSIAAAVAQRTSSEIVYHVSDPSITTIEVNFVSYSPDLATRSAQGVNSTIVWSGLRHDVLRLPEIPEVQAMFDVHQSLSALMVHPDLQRVAQ